MLYETLKETRNNLRKMPEADVEFKIVTLLLGEIETLTKRNGSNASDDLIIATTKKLIKSNIDTIKLTAVTEKLEREVNMLYSLIPKQLSETEIRNILVSSVFGTVGEAIKMLDKAHSGCYDRGVASKIAKELL